MQRPACGLHCARNQLQGLGPFIYDIAQSRPNREDYRYYSKSLSLAKSSLSCWASPHKNTKLLDLLFDLCSSKILHVIIKCGSIETSGTILNLPKWEKQTCGSSWNASYWKDPSSWLEIRPCDLEHSDSLHIENLRSHPSNPCDSHGMATPTP